MLIDVGFLFCGVIEMLFDWVFNFWVVFGEECFIGEFFKRGMVKLVLYGVLRVKNFKVLFKWVVMI